MCLRNLFCGEGSCTWLLFIIIILLLINNSDCDDGGYDRGREGGCGCGC